MARRLVITSRFEWAVVTAVIVIAGFAVVATEAQSERLAMTLTIRNMRTGLRLAIAEKLLRGEENRMEELLERNPLDFIGEPGGGKGETWGDWKFDERRRELIYRPIIALAFEGRRELRWRIEAVPGPGGKTAGVRLVEVPRGQ